MEQEVPNEFLLMIYDGEDEDTKDDDLFGKPKQQRSKAAYYKNIERKMVLKKKRVDVSFTSSYLFPTLLTHRKPLCYSNSMPTKTNGMSSRLHTRPCPKRKKTSVAASQKPAYTQVRYFHDPGGRNHMGMSEKGT